jgi:hypothetical protein
MRMQPESSWHESYPGARRVQALIWTLIAGTGVLDALLFAAEGMALRPDWYFAALVLLLYGLSLVMGRRYPPVAVLLTAFAHFLLFEELAHCLTYGAMAASPFPLADAWLSRADAALRFDWPAWFAWVRAHPEVHAVLAAAYASIPRGRCCCPPLAPGPSMELAWSSRGAPTYSACAPTRC